MNKDYTEEELFKCNSREELKRLAVQGLLAWKGKKVVLDPFTEVDFHYEVRTEGPNYIVQCKMGDAIFPLGILEHQVFKFWKDGGPELLPRTLTAAEIKKLIDEKEPLVWKSPIPQWNPLPLLILKDRTGAFADLWMDYGPLGKIDHPSTPEELFWEKDLLETDFIKKIVGNAQEAVAKPRFSRFPGSFEPISDSFCGVNIKLRILTPQKESEIGQNNPGNRRTLDFATASHYYCPLDKVVKSLTFLLDIGWTIIDHQGKKVIRSGVATWKTQAEHDHILVQGHIDYGNHRADITNVVGAFNRRDRFINLSPHEVGLLEFSPAWMPLAEEEIVQEGIKVKRHHVGLLEDIVPIPPEYQAASWEDIDPGSGFQGTLFDYQREGLQWLSYLYRSRFSGLLADEMGLGKTVQVIAFLSTLTLTKPVLIVMPVSLLFHWRKEFERFFPSMPEDKLILTSYAKLRNDRLFFESLDFEAVILDEAQAIKNPDTLTAQIACRLKATLKLAMTGTPIENRYDDLWSLFRFIMPELLKERKESPVLERIRKKIRPFTLRRTKKEVDLQLPEKEQQIVWVNLEEEQQNFYDQYLKEKRAALVQRVETHGISSQKMEILELILRLRQICCHPRLVTGEYTGASGKFEAVCADLEEVITSGHKVLLYSQFTSVLALFRQWMEQKGWPFAYLDGQTKDREKEVEAFQTNPAIQVFLMSLKAGGVGLNLQAADYVFLYDPWWNSAAEQQAIDRAHRVGRKNRVIARKYLMAETIEEKILKLQTQKATLSEQLFSFENDLQAVSLEELYLLLA